MLTKKSRRASVAVLIAGALAATSLITMTQANAAPGASGDGPVAIVNQVAAGIQPQWTYRAPYTVTDGVGTVSGSAASAAHMASKQPATAEPLVDKPSTTPCVVTLFENYKFVPKDGAPPQDYSYAGPPAACPGPWAKVVMENEIWMDANSGLYDKTSRIFLGGVTLYYGTTMGPGVYSEDSYTYSGPNPKVVPRSVEEVDVTEYSDLFMTAQPGVVHFDNDAFQSYNAGVIEAGQWGTSKLYFYPLEAGQDAPAVADKVMSLEPDTREAYVIWSNTQSLSYTFNAPGAQQLPRNMERMYLDFHREGQRNDEFYTNNDGVAALREFVVKIDGVPAGVAPAYPYKYTYSNGVGYNFRHWTPIPAVQALNFVAYRVDLTPFAGALSDGAQHTVSIDGAGLLRNTATTRTPLFSNCTVARGCTPLPGPGYVLTGGAFFYIAGNLVVYTDKDAATTSGAVTQNTLTATPTVTARTNPISALLTHDHVISGYVNTSHGQVVTTLDQKIKLDTNFTNATTSVRPNANHRTDYNLTTTVANGSNTAVTKVDLQYYEQNANHREDRLSTNGYVYSYQAAVNGKATHWLKLSDLYQANVLTTPNATSRQRYVAFDSTDNCYDRYLTANTTSGNPSLASVTDHEACDALVAPVVKLSASPKNYQAVGEDVVLTATLGDPAATGAVEFFAGDVSLGSVPVVAGVVAPLTTSAIAAGRHFLTAHYQPDFAAGGVYKGSVSNSVVYTVTSTKVSVEDLDVTVVGGDLSLEVPVNPLVSFGSHVITGSDTIVGGISMNEAFVSDLRGTDEGWTLTGVASDFVGDNTARRILAANLGWVPFVDFAPLVDEGLVHDPDNVAAKMPGAAVVPGKDAGLSVPKTLCHTGAGISTGRFVCGAELKLGIPWSTPADHYTSVLTLTLI
ncbi:MAG: hypothetical protein FWD59_07415 [Micrococcales bacterium]|nr:hypothetical protein [Micrococcales bacterium]